MSTHNIAEAILNTHNMFFVEKLENYHKCPKFQILHWIYFWHNFCFFVQMFLKILSEMANSVDPDQTAPSGAVWCGSALFAYAILSYTLVYKI